MRRIAEDRKEAEKGGARSGPKVLGFGICGYRECRKRYPKQRSWQKFCHENHRSLEWQRVTTEARDLFLSLKDQGAGDGNGNGRKRAK